MREAVKNIKHLWKFRNVRLNTELSSDVINYDKLTRTPDEHPDWSKAVGEAEKIVGYPTSILSLRFLLSDEFANVAFHLRKLVGTSHPLLRTVKNMIMQNGKPNFGLVVLLVAKAGGLREGGGLENEIDVSSGILHKQRALAEVVEMMHTSYAIHGSLLNLKSQRSEDVDNYSPASSELHYGNKISLLSGDYILSRCFHVLATIRNQELNEIVSSALRDLSECDFVGRREAQNVPLPGKPNSRTSEGEEIAVPDIIDSTPFEVDRFLGNARAEWTLRTLLGGASLLAKCCRGVLKLAGLDEDVQKSGYTFGRNLALSWQACNETKLFLQERDAEAFSLVSAPVLFQLERQPSLYEMIAERGSASVRNVDFGAIRDAVLGGDALERTRRLQEEHYERAVEVLRDFPAADARNALFNIANAIKF